MNMGALTLKNMILLFLLLSSSLLSSSFAGRLLPEFVGHSENTVGATHEKEEAMEAKYNHVERLLRANLRDYGTYDPAPTFSKPPFKLIPN